MTFVVDFFLCGLHRHILFSLLFCYFFPSFYSNETYVIFYYKEVSPTLLGQGFDYDDKGYV